MGRGQRKPSPVAKKYPVYYWVSKEVPTKEEFIQHMNLIKLNGTKHKPHEHGMMNWEEYIESCWQNRQEEDRELEKVYYDPTTTNIDEVRQRIKERVENFLGFWPDMAENQIVTDDCQKIPLPTTTIWPEDFGEPKLHLQYEYGDPEDYHISARDKEESFNWGIVISFGAIFLGVIMYGIGVLIG